MYFLIHGLERVSIHWPVLPPELTPLNLFVWGYQMHFADLEDLKHRICKTQSTFTPAMRKAAYTKKLLRVFETCVESDGVKFKHVLK